MKILIVGAGIAGSATGALLARQGHAVSVIDAAEEPHTGGYQILLDDVALTVLDRLGVADIAEAHSLPSPAISVRWNGRTLAQYMPRGERIARRGDLVGALSQRIAREVPMVFGRQLVGIQQHVAGVTAHFSQGPAEDYDLIIGADGVNSTVRRLAIEEDTSSLYRTGRATLWVNVPGRIAEGRLGGVLLGGGFQMQVFPYPDSDRTLIVASTNARERRLDVSQTLPRVAQRLTESGTDFAQLAHGALTAAPDECRVTAFTQVRSPKWHARKVILVGDAAHCIDPLSGVGAHASLLGASILADELQRYRDDISTAAARYTRRTTGFTRPAQLATAAIAHAATASSPLRYLRATGSLIAAAATTRSTPLPQVP